MSKSPNEYHLVVYDPGGTIGWTHFVLDCKAFSRPEHKVLRYIKSWDCGEFTGQEHEQEESAVRLIREARFGEMPFVSDTDIVSEERTDIVSEDFELTQTIGGKNLLSPVRINAVLEWECRRAGLVLHLQRRTLRTSVTPTRLTRYGFDNNGKQWTTTGKGKDAFAAMQHSIVWLRRIKDISRSKPWKLSDGQTNNAFWDCSCERGRRNGRRRRCDLSHPRY